MKKFMKKPLAIVLAVVLLVGVVAGTTLAWLTDETQEVQNTFTVGNINIDLKETDSPDDADTDSNKNDYKMIPGWTITKNPVATVLANSEDCYLFVELTSNQTITEANGVYSIGKYLEYQMADGWTLVPGETNVYYRVVETATTAQEFHVIKDDTVKVKDAVTKSDMDALDARIKYLTLNVTAYAIQRDKTNNTPFGAEAAWSTYKGN